MIKIQQLQSCDINIDLENSQGFLNNVILQRTSSFLQFEGLVRKEQEEWAPRKLLGEIQHRSRPAGTVPSHLPLVC